MKLRTYLNKEKREWKAVFSKIQQAQQINKAKFWLITIFCFLVAVIYYWLSKAVSYSTGGNMARLYCWISLILGWGYLGMLWADSVREILRNKKGSQ